MSSSVKSKPYSPAGSNGLKGLNQALAGAKGGDEKRTANHQNKTPKPWEKLVREAAVLEHQKFPVHTHFTAQRLHRDCILPGLTSPTVPVTKNTGILLYWWLKSCGAEGLPFPSLP